MSEVLVAGASLAGLTAAETLRREGFDGRVTVVDPSPGLPPDRPPLSKQVLSGEWEPEQAAQGVAARLDELDLDLRLGTAAVALDAATREVALSDGSRRAYDGIVIATGASPRELPGPRPAGVHVLRTMEDCLALRAELDAGPDRVVVIGAGFIGAEVAATCRGRGHAVTLVEAGPAPLGRVLPGAVGSFVTELHVDHGVDVRVGVGVAGLDAEGGRVRGVRLADGHEIPAELVVVGIGVAPVTGWLEGSGLVLDDGVVCDETCLAAAGIVAAGDVARWPNSRFGVTMRVEQWENAVEQGEHAARRLLAELGAPGGSEEPYAPLPWFWSDQYDRKIQMAGHPSASDEVELVEGSFAERRFVTLFRDGDRCTGVFGVNRPRHVMQARMQLAESLEWGPVRGLFG